MLAAVVLFDPCNRICFDPLLRLGFALEAIDYRLSPSREGETNRPLTVFRFHRFENGFRPRSVHGASIGTSGWHEFGRLS
jgi:hypothetical protein